MGVGEKMVEGEKERRKGEKRRTRENGMVKMGKDRNGEQERDILIEGVIMGLARNLALEKFPGIHKDDPR